MSETNGVGTNRIAPERQLALNAQFEKMGEAVANAFVTRAQLWQKFLDPRRDIDSECGYPSANVAVDPEVYERLYRRDAIAGRVVDVIPEESWQVQPEVYQGEEPGLDNAFNDGVKNLSSMLRGEENYFRGTEGDPVWDVLKRADKMAGRGRYSIILIGVNDGLSLDQLAQEKDGQEILYLRVFPEAMAPIAEMETDQTSRRFGQPRGYNVNFMDLNEGQTQGQGVQWTITGTTTSMVHWTRVVHIVKNVESSEVLGTVEMESVLNRVLDCNKLYGGSAEMYWQGAFPGLSFETAPGLTKADLEDPDALKSMIENYRNGLQRYLLLMGMSAKTLSPQVVDPSPHIDKQIEAICIRKNIPLRIFKGSERGELASSQDERGWQKRMGARQRNEITPRVILPFFNRLIALGVIPKPDEEEGYNVWWPDLSSQTDVERADLGAKITEALAKYVGGNVEALIPPIEFLVHVMGWDEDVAEQVVEAAKEALEAKQEEDLLLQEQQMLMQAEADAQAALAQSAAVAGIAASGEPQLEPIDDEDEEEESEVSAVTGNTFRGAFGNDGDEYELIRQ